MKTLMLFTDGGAFPKAGKKFDAASAFRVLKKKKPVEDSELFEQFVDVTPDKTMAYAEIHAIEKGLEHICSHINGLPMEEWSKYTVHVFTDSHNCYKTMTAWMYAWLKVAKRNNTKILKSSTGNEVKHQKEMIQAFFYKTKLEKMGVHVRFFHINSHITKPKMEQIWNDFQKFNNFVIPKKEFMYYALQNSLCDKALNAEVKRLRTMGGDLNEIIRND